MDIRGLRLVSVLADSHTFTRAAERLGVSRQAVARMLARLESEFGETLFDRRSGELVATEFGKPLVADARDIVERYDDFCRDYLRPIGSPAQAEPPVTVALVNGGSRGLPDSFFERYAAMRPQMRLEVEEMSTDAVLSAVLAEEADIGIVGSHPELLTQYEICTVQPMGIWLLVPQDHPYAQSAHLDIRALDAAPLVTAGRHNHLHRFVMQRCDEAGVSPQIKATATEGSTLLKLVHELGAMCFGFSPEVIPPPEGLVPVRLDVRGGNDFGTYAIRLAKPSHREARRFWRYIQAHEGAAGTR